MITVKEIAELICGQILGDSELVIENVLPLRDENITKNTLSWVSLKNIEVIKSLTKGVYIVPSIDFNTYSNKITLIKVENPRRSFSEVLSKYFLKIYEPKIEKSASIGTNCVLGKDIYIGKNCVIENECKIGDNSIICHNTVINEKTIIGCNVRIGSNCSIGGNGFGYEKNKDNIYSFIPHIGNVIIGDNVDIGNNTCIDRGVIGATTIAKNVKIDNLVHIAHGVSVGENSMIIANSMIAGSVVIEKNCWVAPSSSIRDSLTIGEGATIGLGAVAVKTVISGDIVAGVPAISIKTK